MHRFAIKSILIKMKRIFFVASLMIVGLFACNQSDNQEDKNPTSNPLFPEFNEPVDYSAITVDHLTEGTKFILEDSKSRIDQMLASSDLTFDGTLLEMDNIGNGLSRVGFIGYLLGSTHQDSLLRNTAMQKALELRKFSEGLQQNKELYGKFKAYSETEEAKNLQGYKKKSLQDVLNNFEKNGMQLNDEDRGKLKVLKTEIVDITSKFSQNISTYQDYLEITEEESAGLLDDFKKQRKTETGTYKVDMSYPSLRGLLKFSPLEDVRKRMMVKFSNRAVPDNLEVLDQLLAKRHEMATLLGFESYAAYNLTGRMAKTTKTVWDFENDLVGKVKEKAKADYAALLAIKKADGNARNKDVLNRWDLSYYTEKLKQNEYELNSEEVKTYFSMDNALEGVFLVTQNLFGLEYKEITTPQAWHEEVKMYEVYKNEKLIGRFYLDLYPRPNKYTHMACFPLIPGKSTPQGYQIPTASLVCNFPQPTEEKPSLLSHGQVETLFHEFGHVLHNMLYNGDLANQSILSVKRDFVEAPSQIFENWTWEYDVLKLFAKHYETGEVLPKSLFDKMVAAKNVNSGMNAQSQIFLGMYDFTLHDKYSKEAPLNTDQVAKEVSDKTTIISRVTEGSHFQASFGHLTGYGASYYGYLWSLVYAQDMYSLFEKNGPLDATTGQRYGDIILAKGSSKEELDLVKEFLGREPNNEAFIKSLGL